MRKIGDLPSESEATMFSTVLRGRGIPNDVESEDDGAHSIWVHDDDQRKDAAALLESFRASPTDARWQSESEKARVKDSREKRRKAKEAPVIITRERIAYERDFRASASVPIILAVIALVVTIAAGEIGIMPSSWMPPVGEHVETEETQALRRTFEIRQRLAMTEWRLDLSYPDMLRYAEVVRTHGPDSFAARSFLYDPTLPEVRRGQIWRLFSSIFIHFGILHLVFNVMWLRELGGFIQVRFGAGYLLALAGIIAVLSNYAQLLWSGPGGGGLSGVVYGLFGFVWMRGKFDRTSFCEINPQVVQTMMVWFFLCFTPLIPNVANAAHAAGLIVGGIGGALTGKLASRRRR